MNESIIEINVQKYTIDIVKLTIFVSNENSETFMANIKASYYRRSSEPSCSLDYNGCHIAIPTNSQKSVTEIVNEMFENVDSNLVKFKLVSKDSDKDSELVIDQLIKLNLIKG